MKTLVFCFYFLFSFLLFSNNILVSNVSLTGMNTVSKYTMVKFDISWENSWKTSTLESNWDAAWVFVKYRKKSDINWFHASLNDVGHVAPIGSAIDPGYEKTNLAFNSTTNPAVGAFIYRSSDGIGNVSFSDVELRWNYGVNGLADYDSVEVCVFAIEMVNIPQNAFYLGDNVFPATTSAAYFVAGSTTNPFQVSSEAALTIGNALPTELWAINNNGGAGLLVANFPKGYQSFYIMKYELSQFMYKEFLNKLTRTQQANRASNTTVGNFLYSNNTMNSPSNRNGVKLMSDPGGLLPRVYGNDLNDNDVEGEAGDGQYLACNWISFDDLRAFGDWSGLRPYTEMEFEKTARGTLNPVGSEFAWGTTNYSNATSISNSGQSNEVAGNAGANIVAGNAAGVQGPMRTGNFAAALTNREQAGSGYYGVLDLSGNLWEYVYSVGVVNNRTFDGQNHGNGTLTVGGSSDVASWPNNCGIKGMSFLQTIANIFNANTSDRTYINGAYTSGRYATTCIRLARTTQ